MRLASSEELALHMGVAIENIDTARADQLLTLASSDVADACSRASLERVVDDVLVLTGRYDRDIDLPGGPVVSVSEVKVDGEVVDPADYKLLTEGLRGTLRRSAGYWGAPDVQVEVTYTHGYEAVPDVVKGVVLAYAARMWVNPEGMRSKDLDGIGGGRYHDPGLLKGERRRLGRMFGNANGSTPT